MDQGLAAQMVYGSGEGQNTKHYYAGARKKMAKVKKGSKKEKSGCKK